MTAGALALGSLALRRSSLAWALPTLLLATAATLLRQTGLALLAGLAVASIPAAARSGFSRRNLAIAAGVAALLAAGILARELAPPSTSPGEAFGIVRYLHEILLQPSAAYSLARNGLPAWLYLGLFCAPVALLVTTREQGTAGRYVTLSAAAMALVGPVLLEVAGLRMPLGKDTIRDWGLGPATIEGMELLPHAPALLWHAVAAAAFGGATLVTGRLVVDLWNNWRERTKDPAWLLLVGFAGLLLAAQLVRTPFFDRYYLPALPPLFALLWLAAGNAPPAGARWRAAGAVVLVVFATYGVLGTRDYLDHHRARNALLAPLLERGVDTRRIAGGFEFGGFHHFSRAWVWVWDDEYLVSYAHCHPGYRRIDERSYRRRLFGDRESVYLHLREDGAGTASDCAARSWPHWKRRSHESEARAGGPDR